MNASLLLRPCLALALLGALACSKTRTIARDAHDGGLDGAVDDASSDAAPGDLDGDDDPDGDDSHDAGPLPSDDDLVEEEDGDETPRCANSTYTTAPSGAPCDPERIYWAQGLVGTCLGPVSGEAWCHELKVWVGVGETVPPGFETCEDGKLGEQQCFYSFGDAGRGGALDDAALEAACAATLQLPARQVGCVVYGS